VSHYENNYVGAVKRLTANRGATRRTGFFQGARFVINGLKREELIADDSMILHEATSTASAVAAARVGRLRKRSRAISAASSGWCARNFRRWAKRKAGLRLGAADVFAARQASGQSNGRLIITNAVAGGGRIVALDMYEHAYHHGLWRQGGRLCRCVHEAINWDKRGQALRTPQPGGVSGAGRRRAEGASRRCEGVRPGAATEE